MEYNLHIVGCSTISNYDVTYVKLNLLVVGTKKVNEHHGVSLLIGVHLFLEDF